MKRLFSLLILILILVLGTGISSAQQVVSLTEKDSVVIASLQKGKRFFGIGGNLTADRNKNMDELIYYVLDEHDRDLHVRVKGGWFIKDRNAVGARVAFERVKLGLDYVTGLNDTIYNNDKSHRILVGIFQKYYTPVFDSRRVYFITQPEINYDYENMTRVRQISDEMPVSANTINRTLNLGIHFGFAIFPVEGLSIEGKVGPLGMGYSWETFYGEKDRTINSENFFINLAPKVDLISFTFTSYF